MSMLVALNAAKVRRRVGRKRLVASSGAQAAAGR